MPPTPAHLPRSATGARRVLAALCLLGGLAAIGASGLTDRPLTPDGAPDRPVLAAERPTPTAAPAEALPAPGAGPPATLESAAATVARAAAATAAPQSTPTPRPTANLQASPLASNASLPSWAVSVRETDLWSGPIDGTLFTKVPDGATFRVLDRQAGRFRVFYPGDGARRAPGEAWVDIADLQPVPWPRWVRLREAANVMTLPGGAGVAISALRRGSFLEVLGEERGSWARVHFVGDGREAPIAGWLDVGPTMPAAKGDTISTFALTYDLLAGVGPEVWLKIPHRSQIDGTPYADANCGPTVGNMVLEAFGFRVPQPALRKEVLALQPGEDCDDCGVYLQNIAEVIARRGLKVNRLRDNPEDPSNFHHWTHDEIRAELRAGRPVVVQVFYRGLPGRATVNYWGDHYVVLHGLAGDRFLFNDPVDSDGPGYSRLISAQQLDYAMSHSDFPYAGFSVGR